MKTIRLVKTIGYNLEPSLHKSIEEGNMHTKSALGAKKGSLPRAKLLSLAMGLLLPLMGSLVLSSLPIEQALAGGTCSGGCGGNSYQGKMMSEYAHRIYPEAKQKEIPEAKEIRETIQNIAKINPRYGRELGEAAKGLVIYLLPGLQNKKLAEKITGLKIDTDQEALHNGESEVLENKEKFSAKNLESKVHFLVLEMIEEHLSKRYPEAEVKKLHASARKLTDLIAPARGKVDEKKLQEGLAGLNLGYYLTSAQEIAKKEAEKKAPAKIVNLGGIVVLKNNVPMDFSTPQTLKIGDKIHFQVKKQDFKEGVTDEEIEYSYWKCWYPLDDGKRKCDQGKKIDSTLKTIESIITEKDANEYMGSHTFCANGKKSPEHKNTCTHIIFNPSEAKVKRTDLTEAGGHDVFHLPVQILDREGKNKFAGQKPNIQKVVVFVNGIKIDSVSNDGVYSNYYKIPQELKKGDVIRLEVVADTDPTKQIIYKYLSKYGTPKQVIKESSDTSYEYTISDNDQVLDPQHMKRINIAASYANSIIRDSFATIIDYAMEGESKHVFIEKMDLYINDSLIDPKKEYFPFVKLGDRIRVVAHVNNPSDATVQYQWSTNNGSLVTGQNTNTIELIVGKDFFRTDEARLQELYARNPTSSKQNAIYVKINSANPVIDKHRSSVHINIKVAELLGLDSSPAPEQLVQRLGVQVSQEKLGFLNRKEATSLKELIQANDPQNCKVILGRLDEFLARSDRQDIEILGMLDKEKQDSTIEKCIHMVQENLPAILQNRGQGTKAPQLNSGESAVSEKTRVAR